MSSASRLASTEPAYAGIVNAVTEAILSPRWPGAVWSFGPLEINDFSFCIAGTRLNAKGTHGVYIKIPKRQIATRSLDAIDDADRTFGEVENQSLELLADTWPTDDEVHYVEVLGRIENINALVTRRIFGEDFSVWLRKVEREPNELAISRLGRVGRSLAEFHANRAGQDLASRKRLAAKFASYVERLRRFDVRRHACGRIVGLASAEAIKSGCTYSPVTATLKGLDVRNLLIERDGRLVFLDPGAIKPDSPLADYARFAATLRLLYWGRMSFFVGRTPRAEYRQAFERGYFGGSAPAAARIFELKELCKMWLMAHVALQGKSWPGALKHVMRSAYINRFFERWLEELSRNWSHE